MTMLEARPFLRAHNLDANTRFACPRCSTEFAGADAIVFHVNFTRDSQAMYGPLMFCSTLCVLSWNGLELGHA